MTTTAQRVPPSDAVLDRLLVEQCGLVTRAQLMAAGRTRSEIRWALRGRWHLVLPNVINTTGPRLTAHQRLVAALLHAGEGSMIAAATAAAWHGVTAAVDDPRVHVQVPMERRPASAGFVVIRRTRCPDEHPWLRGALTISSRGRAVIDAARDAGTLDGMRAILCEAVERRLVTPQTLRHELEAGPVRGRRLLRSAVEDVEAGAWSVPEAELLGIVGTSSILPAPWANPRLTAADGTVLPTPDLWLDDVGLAAQVHSRQWHSADLDWDRTVMADGVYAEYGITVVGITPRAIRDSPTAVRQRLGRAYRAASARPRPPVKAERSR